MNAWVKFGVGEGILEPVSGVSFRKRRAGSTYAIEFHRQEEIESSQEFDSKECRDAAYAKIVAKLCGCEGTYRGTSATGTACEARAN